MTESQSLWQNNDYNRALLSWSKEKKKKKKKISNALAHSGNMMKQLARLFTEVTQSSNRHLLNMLTSAKALLC